MARPRGFRQDCPRSNRRTMWELGPGSAAGAPHAVSATGKTIIGEGVTPTVSPLTIVRTHGQMSLALFTAAAAGDGFLVAVGQGIVSEDAFAVGTTALPGPLTDPEWPGWYYHRIVYMISMDATPAGSDVLTQVSLNLETKGMRKLGLNEITMLIIEVIEIGTATMEVFGLTRVLFKD